MAVEALYMYAIYDHPTDYPDGFVVRRWRIGHGEPIPDEKLYMYEKNVEIIHAVFTGMGLTFLVRSPTDDPCIIGTYL